MNGPLRATAQPANTMFEVAVRPVVIDESLIGLDTLLCVKWLHRRRAQVCRASRKRLPAAAQKYKLFRSPGFDLSRAALVRPVESRLILDFRAQRMRASTYPRRTRDGKRSSQDFSVKDGWMRTDGLDGPVVCKRAADPIRADRQGVAKKLLQCKSRPFFHIIGQDPAWPDRASAANAGSHCEARASFGDAVLVRISPLHHLARRHAGPPAFPRHRRQSRSRPGWPLP